MYINNNFDICFTLTTYMYICLYIFQIHANIRKNLWNYGKQLFGYGLCLRSFTAYNMSVIVYLSLIICIVYIIPYSPNKILDIPSLNLLNVDISQLFFHTRHFGDQTNTQLSKQSHRIKKTAVISFSLFGFYQGGIII